VDGVLGVEVTRFGTKTFWHHVTTTATVTKERFLTSRTTTWISAPSGFVGVRDAISHADGESKREVKHPHTKRQSPSTSSTKAILARPTQGRYAIAVHCERQIRIHTTQVLLLTASKRATVTAQRETVFKNRTVYGTVTSTILALPTTIDTALLSSVSGSGSGISSTPSSPSTRKRQNESTLSSSSSSSSSLSTSSFPSQDPQKIVTNTTTVTKTPYTISFTWTATTTTTTTKTLHATTTITSYAACASANLLGQTSRMLRINGVAFADTSLGGGNEGGVEDKEGVEEVETSTASGCCEECMQKRGCLWSIYQASGEKKGSCYLILLSSKHQGEKGKGNKQRGEKEVVDAIETEVAEAGVCTTQENKGTFGYSSGNGEVGYVVSNGLCGMLLEAPA
jgi:hypothetical protein